MGIITIKSNADFQKAYARGTSRVGPSLVLYRFPNREAFARFGFVASKRVGKAVVRNRLRRVLKEICRRNEGSFTPGYDYVVVARPRAANEDYGMLEEQLLSLVKGFR
ncbi:MAG: ribonuclease P protein component [Bacillota bacterium]